MIGTFGIEPNFVANDTESVQDALNFLRDEYIENSQFSRGCITDINPFTVLLEFETKEVELIRPWRTSGWIVSDISGGKCGNSFVSAQIIDSKVQHDLKKLLPMDSRI